MRRVLGILLLFAMGPSLLFLALCLVMAVKDPGEGGITVAVVLAVLSALVGLALWFAVRLIRYRPPPRPHADASRGRNRCAGPNVRNVPRYAPFPDGDYPEYRSLTGEALRLKQDLLALNGEDVPFVVREGGREQADLVAEWRLYDAEYQTLVGMPAKAKSSLAVFMKFYPEKCLVRTLDVARSCSSTPMGARFSYQRGQRWAAGYQAALGWRDDGTYGVVYSSRYSTKALKGPLWKVIADHGWKRKGVVFGKL